MKTTSKRVLNGAKLCFLLTLSFTVISTQDTGLNAKEKEGRKAGRSGLAKSLVIDDIKAFDGNRIFNYVSSNGQIVTFHFDQNAGFHWPSVPRSSRDQDGEEELKGANTADFASGLWIVGTVNGQPRTAIAYFLSEYIAGKILPDGQPDNAGREKYRIYKIMKGDGPGVKDWDEWPVEDGAPVNPDGTPKLIGDQTLWWVMNDLEEARHQAPIAGSPPIGLEVQTTIFGFNDRGPLGDIMFVEWQVINKGTADLDSAFIAVWDDADLGFWADDLVGADTSLGLGYFYNGARNDLVYGTRTPALGFDFFQGPEVPKGSGNFLKMTSFVKFTNSAPVGRRDPVNVEEVYNYMTGYWGDGSPVIDPITGEDTKFMHTGDPVTGLGDLDFTPADRRFLMSSGPFTLAVGDTQVISGAKIVAPGIDPPSSVNALRFFDKFAQGAFDNDFDVLRSPDIERLAIRRLDQEIILSWFEEADEIESFEKIGYTFQGYIVYQGQSVTGPWKQIAIYDLNDGIQAVIDEQFDAETGLIVSAPAVLAKDSGLQRYIRITHDAIFNPDQRLSNYRDYYFAVTTYSVNLEGVPKVVESAIVGKKVAPTAADFGVAFTEEFGNTMPVEHDNGIADGTFLARIVDPTMVPDATYGITFNDDHSMSVTKNGGVVATVAEFDHHGVSNYTHLPNAPIIDGLQIHLIATFEPPNTFSSVEFTTDANPSDGDLLLLDFTAFGFPNGLHNPFADADMLSPDLQFRFTGLTANGDDDNEAPIVEGGQWTTQWERAAIFEPDVSGFAHVQMRAPFELWDVENDRQVNFAVLNRNRDGASPYGDGVGDPDTQGMEPRWRIAGRDYIIPIMTDYEPETAETTIHAPDDLNSTWIFFFLRFSTWSNGDVYTVFYTNPLKPGGDEFSITTQQGMVPGQEALKQEQLQKINIVPNPYWAHNPGERDPINRFIRLTNLPGSGVKIRIFTLAGDLVRVIDDADRQTDGTLGLQYANWDLRNDAGIPVSSGVYLIHFEVAGVGNVLRKAAIILPEERLDIF